jgi:hypothetical protein
VQQWLRCVPESFHDGCGRQILAALPQQLCPCLGQGVIKAEPMAADTLHLLLATATCAGQVQQTSDLSCLQLVCMMCLARLSALAAAAADCWFI